MAIMRTLSALIAKSAGRIVETGGLETVEPAALALDDGPTVPDLALSEPEWARLLLEDLPD